MAAARGHCTARAIAAFGAHILVLRHQIRDFRLGINVLRAELADDDLIAGCQSHSHAAPQDLLSASSTDDLGGVAPGNEREPRPVLARQQFREQRGSPGIESGQVRLGLERVLGGLARASARAYDAEHRASSGRS